MTAKDASGKEAKKHATFSVADVPTTIKVFVKGWAEDGPFEAGEWATATTMLDVGGLGGPGESFTKPKPFTMTSVDNETGGFKFKVSDTFDVSYRP